MYLVKDIEIAESRLKKATNKYWEELDGDDTEEESQLSLEERFAVIGDTYLGKGAGLVYRELEYAFRKTKQILPGLLVDRPAECLVLLVGLSPEPLIQSILAYQPRHVIFLINKSYGNASAMQMKRLWKKHLLPALQYPEGRDKPDFSNEENAIFIELRGDKPEHVFREMFGFWSGQGMKIKSLAGTERYPLVVDITGGKKSMVSGAFLFASYIDAPISYVDFDIYDQRKGRPYGYTCQIEIQKNPYQLFRLADWHRIQSLYQKYSFGAARELLWGNIQSGKQFGLYDDETITRMKKMQTILSFYERWDNNDYGGAWKIWEDKGPDMLKGFVLPKAVSDLGSDMKLWPQVQVEMSAKELIGRIQEIESGVGEGAFYSTSLPTAVYICDELEKIRRLLGEGKNKLKKPKEKDASVADYRSALIRSAGLVEFILRSVVFQYIRRGWLLAEEYDQVTRKMKFDSSTKLTLPQQAELQAEIEAIGIQDFLAKRSACGLLGREVLINILSSKLKCKIVGMVPNNEGEKKYIFPISVRVEVPEGNAWGVLFEDPSIKTGTKILNDLRNKTIHTFLPISRVMAKNAFDTVEKLKIYYMAWSKNQQCVQTWSQEEFNAIPWQKLCSVCELDIFADSAEILEGDA